MRGETVRLGWTELPGAVGRSIEEAEEKWADLRQLVILEFVLPWELLNEPVEWWSKESESPFPTPLALDYPVVAPGAPAAGCWHRPRHNKWRQLKDHPPDTCGISGVQ